MENYIFKHRGNGGNFHQPVHSSQCRPCQLVNMLHVPHPYTCVSIKLHLLMTSPERLGQADWWIMFTNKTTFKK